MVSTNLEIELPESLEIIGSDAFEASYIKNITIPTGVVEIGSSAFRNCRYLETITFSDTSNWYKTTLYYGPEFIDANILDVSDPVNNVTILQSSYYSFYKKTN